MNVRPLLIERRNFFNANDAGLVFTFALLLMNAVVFIGTIFIGIFSVDSTYASIVLIDASIFFAIFFYCKYKGINMFRALKLNLRLNTGNVIGTLGTGVSMMYAFIIPLIAALYFLDKIGFVSPANDITITNPLDVITATFFIAVLPAIFEEILCRGVILQGLRRFGDFYAVIVSAALFMIIHGNPVQTVYPFLSGIVLGFIFIKTGNLIYPIILHFINNFISVLLEYIQNFMPAQQTEQDLLYFTPADIVLIGLAVVIFTSCMIYFYHRKKFPYIYDSPKVFRTMLPLSGNIRQLLGKNIYGGNIQGGYNQEPGIKLGYTYEENVLANSVVLSQKGFLYNKKDNVFLLPGAEHEQIVPPPGFEDVTKNGRYNYKYISKGSFIVRALAGILICIAQWALMLLMGMGYISI